MGHHLTRAGSRFALRGVFAALAVLALTSTSRVRASDFWDEVRNPGLAQQRVHLRRASAALRENRVELALEEADTAIALCPECTDGYALRGRALAVIGRIDAANDAFEQALRSSPAALDARPEDAVLAASVALRTGRAEQATLLLRRVLASSRPDVPEGRALAMLADALQLLGAHGLKRAIAVYGEAMHAEDARRTALLGFALALHRRGELVEALALARRASEAEQSVTTSWLPDTERAAREALWLQAIGDEHAALAAWERAGSGTSPWSEHALSTLAALRKALERR